MDRHYLASEAKYLGRGGKARIQRLTGTSHNTINRGLEELSAGTVQKPNERIRREGGGRKKAITPAIWSNIESFYNWAFCLSFFLTFDIKPK